VFNVCETERGFGFKSNLQPCGFCTTVVFILNSVIQNIASYRVSEKAVLRCVKHTENNTPVKYDGLDLSHCVLLFQQCWTVCSTKRHNQSQSQIIGY